MKFIFFDLDNTLTDRKATIDAYAEYFLSEFRELLHDDISTDHLSSTFNELDKGGYETHDVRSAAIRDLNIWHNWVPKNSLPMRGIYECLNELLDMGFKLCLVTNLVGGWYDSELTDKGIFDAKALAQTISSDSNVDTVISSDLKRKHRAQSH